MSNPSLQRTRALLAALAWVGVFSWAIHDLAAQQVTEEENRIEGVVLDRTSGQQLSGASVVIGDADRRVFTNRNGGFSVGDLAPGSHPVIVTQLGYDTLRTEVSVPQESGPVTFQLTPDPVVLERVTAMVDRFREQRNSLGYSVRVFEQPQLQTSTDYTVLDFLRSRTFLQFASCPSRAAMSPCARIRGRAVPVLVYLDGAQVVGGLDVLAAYRPEELYSLEILAGGRAIRAFTTWYVETVAQGRRLPPVFLF